LIFKVLLIIILAPVALILIALFTPVFYEIYAEYDKKLKLDVYIFGIKLKNRRKKTTEKPEEDVKRRVKIEKKTELKTEKRKEEKKEKKKVSLKEIFSEINFYFKYPNKEIIIKSCVNLLFKILAVLKPKIFELDAEYGLEDVAATGQIYGALWAFGIIRKDINIKPNFDKEVFLIKLHLKGKILLALLAAPVLKFVLSRPIFKLILDALKRYKDLNKKNKKTGGKAVNYGICGSSG
jgi:phosphate/sulfate permease